MFSRSLTIWATEHTPSLNIKISTPGMGLERLACVMQGVDNMFEVDTIRNILDKVCEISGKKYGADDKVPMFLSVLLPTTSEHRHL